MVKRTLVFISRSLALLAALAVLSTVHAATIHGSIPVEFILFALTLLGVALFHNYTLYVALIGLAAVVTHKLLFAGFKTGVGIAGLFAHLGHEWVTLTNLLCLLMGFALLSKHFEESNVPSKLPAILPDDWKGGFFLLVIGGAMAHTLFKGRVHIGFLAGIVAASNGGGSGSVLGDTTTTMMWIAGVNPLQVLDAYVAALVALLIVGVVAARQQHAYQPILKDNIGHVKVDGLRLTVVGIILSAAMLTNVVINTHYKPLADHFPFIGAAVWVAIFATAPIRKPDWHLLPGAFKGAVFLLSLVMIASLMPVEALPAASWQSTLGLGFVSAVFDNIPLTALAIKQGGYDWGLAVQ
jgi:hypothetical protein